MAKGKIAAEPIIAETAQGENISHLNKRVTKELLWVLVSAVVSVGLGLVIGNLVKF